MENKGFLTKQIITYIGNKRKLLPYIEEHLLSAKNKIGKNKISCLDMFSGSGIVSRLMKKHSSKIVANDLEKYSEIINKCFLSNKSETNLGDLEEKKLYLTERIESGLEEGFISKLYAPQDEENISEQDRVFYTKRNAVFLDTAMKQILLLPEEDRKFFIAPLMSEASVHVNTSGIFKGFYKNKEGIGKFGGTAENALARIKGNIKLCTPIFSNFECEFEVKREDANNLVCENIDFAYLDPPYNQHPYGSNYFMLNLLADYKEPREISSVSGIPKDWNRSSFNRKAEAEKSLFSIVERLDAKLILISYNSEGFVSLERFKEKLSTLGRLSSQEIIYDAFKGSRNLSGRDLKVKEFLFLLEK